MRLPLFILLVCLMSYVRVRAASPTNQSYAVTWDASGSVFLGSTNVTMAPDGYIVLLSTNPALPLAQWTFGTNVPAAQVSALSSNYLAVTQAVVTVPMQPPIFASVTYTNANGSSAPLFSIGGLQAWPVNPVTRSVLPHP